MALATEMYKAPFHGTLMVYQGTNKTASRMHVI
jgi:hypothetical protein